MSHSRMWIACCALLVAVGCGGGQAYEEPKAEPLAAEPVPAAAPTPDEQVAALDESCAAAAGAIAERQARSTLYERLGGREAIRAVVTDVVARHRVNPTISRVMEGVDDGHLIEQVTDFLSQAGGGEVSYQGKDMVTAHEHLALTNGDFLAAGGDVQAALKAAGVGDGEIQEVMCLFASLRDQVVTAPAS